MHWGQYQKIKADKSNSNMAHLNVFSPLSCSEFCILLLIFIVWGVHKSRCVQSIFWLSVEECAKENKKEAYNTFWIHRAWIWNSALQDSPTKACPPFVQPRKQLWRPAACGCGKPLCFHAVCRCHPPQLKHSYSHRCNDLDDNSTGTETPAMCLGMETLKLKNQCKKAGIL